MLTLRRPSQDQSDYTSKNIVELLKPADSKTIKPFISVQVSLVPNVIQIKLFSITPHPHHHPPPTPPHPPIIQPTLDPWIRLFTFGYTQVATSKNRYDITPEHSIITNGADHCSQPFCWRLRVQLGHITRTTVDISIFNNFSSRFTKHPLSYQYVCTVRRLALWWWIMLASPGCPWMLPQEGQPWTPQRLAMTSYDQTNWMSDPLTSYVTPTWV